MKFFGFFEELRHGNPQGGSISSLVREEAHQEESEIVRYLKSGTCLIATPGLEKDVLGDNGALTPASHIFSDGEWVWPGDLAYYITHYHVQVPGEFLAKMRNNQFIAPSLTEDQVIRLSDKLVEGARESDS